MVERSVYRLYNSSFGCGPVVGVLDGPPGRVACFEGDGVGPVSAAVGGEVEADESPVGDVVDGVPYVFGSAVVDDDEG